VGVDQLAEGQGGEVRIPALADQLGAAEGDLYRGQVVFVVAPAFNFVTLYLFRCCLKLADFYCPRYGSGGDRD